MSSEWTLHTGFMGESHLINISWSDHNNVQHRDSVEIRVQDKDKPRTLEIVVNGAILAVIQSDR